MVWVSCSLQVSHAGLLWFFGGFGEKTGRHVFNDLITFNPQNGGSWEVKELQGDFPDPIYLHSAVVYDNKMWVFGGSIGKDSSNSLYSYDFGTSFCIQAAYPSSLYPVAVCVQRRTYGR